MNRFVTMLGASSLVLGSAGCVLPADEPTGLELSWRILEVNTIDGEDAQRLRTCDGGRVEEFVLAITDRDEPSRAETFRYPCSTGYQTLSEFRTESSDAFIELRPRAYEIQIDLVSVTADSGTHVRRVRDLEVDVLERTVTRQDFDFGLEAVELDMMITGTESCDEVAFVLGYADPGAALVEPPLDADGDPVPSLLYRDALSTDAGLSLAGDATSCADLERDHRVVEVDPGDYALEVVLGERVCRIDVAVGAGGAAHVIDLANLPCDG